MMNGETTETYFEIYALSRILQFRFKVHDIDENGFKNNETIYQPEQATKNIYLFFTRLHKFTGESKKR